MYNAYNVMTLVSGVWTFAEDHTFVLFEAKSRRHACKIYRASGKCAKVWKIRKATE